MADVYKFKVRLSEVESLEKLIIRIRMKNLKLMGVLRLCMSRDLQRRTGRFLKIRLLIGRKPI